MAPKKRVDFSPDPSRVYYLVSCRATFAGAPVRGQVVSFPKGADEDEIEETCQRVYNELVAETVDGGWSERSGAELEALVREHGLVDG
jgi:hypothetical protein